MNITIRDDRHLRSLTGVTRKQFDILLEAFTSIFETLRQRAYREGVSAGTRKRRPQGCSILKNPGVIEEPINIHAVFEKLPIDILHFVLTKNIEREASQFREYVRITTDSGTIFTHRNIPDIMIFILNPPISPNTVRYFFRARYRR